MLGLQLVVPSELRVLTNLLWLLFQVILFSLLSVLGGWKIALGACYLLFFKAFLPIAMIIILSPFPNQMLLLFISLTIIIIATILVSIISWRLSHYFSDPHLIQGGSVIGILGGTIWLIVLAILWVYLSAFI